MRPRRFTLRGLSRFIPSQSAKQQFPLEDELLGNLVEDVEDELLGGQRLAFHAFAVESHGLFELRRAVVEAAPIDVLIARHPTERRLACRDDVAPRALADPAEDSHVLPEAGPQVLAVLLAEPVDVE